MDLSAAINQALSAGTAALLLISRLLAENRPDLIALAVSDPDVRARLYKSHNL